MEKIYRAVATALVFVFFLTTGGVSHNDTVYAKSPKKAQKKQKSGQAKVTARAKTKSTPSSAKSKKSTQIVKKSKAGSKRLSASARRRAYLARLRIRRARDAALRNIAATNIRNDNIVGEDLEIRRVALEALGGRSGTVVVMDPNTGRIYSIVNQRMALSSPVKPCSTVKMIVGLAALHEKIFDPNLDLQLASNGYSMGLTEAMARSNNPFFQVLGRQLGYERIISYAQNYGFGAKTNANYEGESEGFLPEEGQEETGHMSSHGDGFGVTAIQLAAFTAAIANGGNLYVPRVPRTPEEAKDFKPQLVRKIEMTPEDRMRILAGMIGAVNFGTAKLAYDPVGQVAGKTGTCTGKSDRLGLFTSFSSVEHPKLVVTVITTGSTEAGARAAAIAGQIYRAISPRFLKDQMLAPASASIELPRQTTTAAEKN
jgi:cell division protein FtsI/penicillin-binding protein 2